MPFIFGCDRCTECCNDERDEVAEECANSEKKCKVRSTPCRRESKPSNTAEAVGLNVSTTLPAKHKRPITSDPTRLETKLEKHTSTVSPTLSVNNLVVDSQSNTNGNDNKALITAFTVCAAFATLGIIIIIIFIAFKFCRRINADTVLAHCNRNSKNDSEVDHIELRRPLTSASQEQLHEGKMFNQHTK